MIKLDKLCGAMFPCETKHCVSADCVYIATLFSTHQELQSRWCLLDSSGVAIRHTSRTAELSSPLLASPQLGTDPPARIAANAAPLPTICCTPLSWSITVQRMAVTVRQLESNCRTVTAIGCITPGNNGSIFQNRSEGPVCGLNPLHTQLSLPYAASMQVTTDPSSRTAAKALSVAWIRCTPNCHCPTLHHPR